MTANERLLNDLQAQYMLTWKQHTYAETRGQFAYAATLAHEAILLRERMHALEENIYAHH